MFLVYQLQICTTLQFKMYGPEEDPSRLSPTGTGRNWSLHRISSDRLMYGWLLRGNLCARVWGALVTEISHKLTAYLWKV